MSTPAWPSPSLPLALLRRAASGRLDAASARACRTTLYGSGSCHHVAPFEPQHPQQRCPITLGLRSSCQRTSVTTPLGRARCFAATAEGCTAHPKGTVTPSFPTSPGTAAVLAAAAVASAAAKVLKPAAGPASGAAGGSTSTAAAPEAAPSPPEPSTTCPSSSAPLSSTTCASSASRTPGTASAPSPSSSSSSNPSAAIHPSTTASASSPPAPSPPSSPSPTSPASSSEASAASSLEGFPVPWVTLGPSLDLIQQRFRVGPGAAIFRLLAPRDVDAVMDLYLEKGLLDADPYWTRAWPSAIALAATLLSRPELVRGKVVADLGAGLGLAGMAAAMAGAKEVVLLDREPLALQCALLSAAATGLDSDPDSHLDPERGASSKGTSVPGPDVDPASAAGPGPGSSSRRRLRLEALPADQLPSHAALQLTPPYKAYARQSYNGSGGAAAAAEWEALLALARGLHCGSEPAAAATSGGSPPTAAASNSPSPGGGSGGDAPYDSVLRAHVFDWTVPPDMERLLPPIAQASPQQQPLPGRGPHAGLRRQRQRRFDAILACDVLYEDAAVGPIAGLMPLLLEPAGGRLLLADPPNRTVRNRERFLQELQSGPLRLAVEECSLQHCEASKLDNEMAGGLAPTAESVPVQFLVFRSCVGNDTVGLKL